MLNSVSNDGAPATDGAPLLSPLEGKFQLTKSAGDVAVKVGDRVQKGQVVCYIEAMKTYNAVSAETDGVITAILFGNGDTVSEDDTLMLIKNG